MAISQQMISWEDIRMNSVVVEDDFILVLNKPSGISVAGAHQEADIVRLAQDSGETLYPVHRIDKVTSGIVVLAKDIDTHGQLTRQFNKRTVEKTYLAITRSTGLPQQGVIDLPLSVGRKNRVRVAAPRERIVNDNGRWTISPTDLLATKNYPSVTEFATLWSGDEHSVLVVKPITGRRHQIRVHLAWIGYPIVGDPLFEKGTLSGRTYLHAWKLNIDTPWRTKQRLQLVADPGSDFWEPIKGLTGSDMHPNWLRI